MLLFDYTDEQMERTKSVGFDQISNGKTKTLPSNYVQCLVNFFYQLLNQCKYLNEWKLAKIITLNKLKVQ
jgi:hypothetical protein